MPAAVDSVIVPLDGSDLAATALPVATRIADRLDARLRLVAVGADDRGKDLRAYLDTKVEEHVTERRGRGRHPLVGRRDRHQRVLRAAP